MSHTHQPHRSSQRDAGLRRLRQINRTLAAATVALTLLFVNAAARAFPGHVRTGKVTSPSAPSTHGASTRRSAVRPARGHATGHATGHRIRLHRAARPPSATTPHAAPRTATAAPDTATSPALSPPASPPQSAPATASAPVVSGGS